MYNNFRMNTNFFSKVTVALFIIPIILIGIISVVDKDKTVSTEENRTLKTKPEFSFSALMNGNYTKDFDEYYSDTFPMRNKFMKSSKKINKSLFQFSAGDDDIVIVQRKTDDDDFKGEALTDDEEWMKIKE